MPVLSGDPSVSALFNCNDSTSAGLTNTMIVEESSNNNNDGMTGFDEFNVADSSTFAPDHLHSNASTSLFSNQRQDGLLYRSENVKGQTSTLNQQLESVYARDKFINGAIIAARSKNFTLRRSVEIIQ